MVKNHHKTLWLLDDNPDILFMLSEKAELLGFKILSMSSMAEAWERFRLVESGAEAPHYVISDFELLDGSSYQWLLQVRKAWPRAKVVCFSGGITSQVSVHLTSAGVEVYKKPMSLDVLLQNWAAE